MKNILVMTSGGDAPGMNAAIRSVVRSAIHKGLNVFGCEMGYQGLLENKIFPMEASHVANCIQRGGTILKSARCDAFRNADIRQTCLPYLADHEIDGLVVLGGDGSFQGAACLSEEAGISVIGIPCTIDNDIPGTDYCIGFDTARNTALEAIDKIRDTAFSHDRNFMIEVMGRTSGALATDVGIAGGAELIIIPEAPLSAQDIVDTMQLRREGRIASIIVVAEADRPGHTIQLAKSVEALCGTTYQVCILGHTQRGGTPSLLDRKMGSVMGVFAVDALIAGENKKMVASHGSKLILCDLPSASHSTQSFANLNLLELNQYLS